LDFLTNLFANIDDAERDESQEITMQTASKFRLVSEVIDVLEQYGQIPDTWNKNKKYCKFKCVDIIKALNSGQVPKRGSPKEAEDETTKELNQLAELEGQSNNQQQSTNQAVNQNNIQPSNTQQNNFNQTFNQQQSTNQAVNQNNIQPSNTQKNNFNQTLNQQQSTNQAVNQNNIQPSNTQQNNFNQTFNQQQNSTQNNVQPNNNFASQQNNYYNPNNNNINNTGYSNNNFNQQNLNQQNNSNNNQQINQNNNIQPSSNNNQPSSNNNSKTNTDNTKVNETKTVTITDKSKSPANIQKLLDIKLPIKKRSIEFYKVIDQVKKHVTSSGDQLKNNRPGCVANATSQLEMALYYFENITEN